MVGVCACGLLFDEELDIEGTTIYDDIVAIPDAPRRQLEVKICGMH